MSITGKRRLIFGLSSVAVAGFVEVYVPAGWSVYGQASLAIVVLAYYGNSAVDKFKNGKL